MGEAGADGTMTEAWQVMGDLRQVVVCTAAGSLPPVRVASLTHDPAVHVTTLPGD